MYYFYTWQNHKGRTCFGVTGNLNGRRKKYIGHHGDDVQFTLTLSGPESHIRDLEANIKAEFWEYLFNTENTENVEWINADITHDQVLSWILWEVDNKYSQIKKIKD